MSKTKEEATIQALKASGLMPKSPIEKAEMKLEKAQTKLGKTQNNLKNLKHKKLENLNLKALDKAATKVDKAKAKLDAEQKKVNAPKVARDKQDKTNELNAATRKGAIAAAQHIGEKLDTAPARPVFKAPINKPNDRSR